MGWQEVAGLDAAAPHEGDVLADEGRADPFGQARESGEPGRVGPVDHRDLITIRREQSRSVIPYTVTTVTRCERVRCGSMTWRDVRLAYVHEYSEPDLDAVIADIGFTIIRKFQRGVRSGDQDRVVLLYLLQKP